MRYLMSFKMIIILFKLAVVTLIQGGQIVSALLWPDFELYIHFFANCIFISILKALEKVGAPVFSFDTPTGSFF